MSMMSAYGQDQLMMCDNDIGNTVNKDTSATKPECEHLHESLGLLVQEEGNNLNSDGLLKLFEGSRDNLNYFAGLWNAVELIAKENVMSDGDDFCARHNCDPRDEGKTGSFKDWDPSITVAPMGLLVNVRGERQNESSETDALELPSIKQTVLEPKGEGQNGFVSSETVENMEGLARQGDLQRFPCGVHGCGQVLSSLANYESHYHHCHSYVCDACRRQFVSNFLLDIHLQENHDSYFAVLSPRIDMFRCLVESCEQKFRSPALRKDHLVSVHKFPSSFSFHQPVKSNRSIQTHEPSVAVGEENVENPKMDIESAQLHGGNDTTSQRKKVPPTICFGRGSQRAFQQRRVRGGGNRKGRNWYQQNSVGSSSPTDTTVNIESVDMKELEEALT